MAEHVRVKFSNIEFYSNSFTTVSLWATHVRNLKILGGGGGGGG